MNTETNTQIWQSNGALEILLSTLIRVEKGTIALLAKEGSLVTHMKAFVAEHFEPLAAAGFQGRVEDVVPQETLNKGAALGLAIGNLAASLSCDVRTANLMAAVDLEAAVNQFLVLHLSERVVESIDRLSVTAKLTIAQSILGLPDFAGSREEKAISELFDWRNAFAHGKLPGFKKNLSLRMLHLKTFDEMGGADPQRDLREMQKLLDGYIAARQYLRSIARHPKIFTPLFDIAHVEQVLHQIKMIKQVRFRDWHLTETERRQNYGRTSD